MQEFTLYYKNSIIHYQCVGNSGGKPLFCFHGYGEEGNSFSFLEPLLAEGYRIIAINLPFHGKTEWREDLLFTPADLLKIIYQINTSLNQPISLLGYSMGGRVSLQLLQLIPEKIERVILIAPDGLHKNFWYWLSTQTWLGNKLFIFTTKKPGWLFGLMKIAGILKMIDKSILKIARNYLENEKERALLYQRWTTMRKFRPSLPFIKSALRNHAIAVRFLFGKHDKIILSKRSDFLVESNLNVSIKIIEAGHQMLKEKYAQEIASLFYQ